jgi:hypothetical protein
LPDFLPDYCPITAGMKDLAIIIEQVKPATPRELAKCIGVSVTQVQIALAALGRFILPDQQVDAEIVLAVARHMELVVKGDAVYSPAPPGLELKPNWTAFQVNVRKRHLRELYHFTPLDNLPGIIAAGGVLSRRQTDERGLKSLRNSWGNPEKEHILGTEYICLSITNQWKMLSSVMMKLADPPAVLVVAPRVIWYEGTCFLPKNSASREIVVSRLPTWTDVAHFDALFPAPDARGPVDVQAEVLVRDYIPLGDISKIAFHNQDAFKQAWELCGLDQADPLTRKVRIKKSYYPDRILA